MLHPFLRLLAFAGVVTLASTAWGQDRAALVKVDEVVQRPLAQTMPVIGRFVSRQHGVVSALSRGPVSEVEVEVGDRVQKGDVLVRLDTARIRANLALERAALSEKEAAATAARGQLALAEQELQRLERLKKSAAFSQASYDDKRKNVNIYVSEVAEAEAAAARAQSNLRLVEIDLDYSAIRAPFDGVVSERHTEAGTHLNIGDPVVTLVNDSDLEVEADVPSDRIGGLLQGVVLEVVLADGGRHEAVVRAVVPDENAMTRTRPVRLTPAITDENLSLAANQSVTVMIPVGEPRDVVSVSKDAIIARGNGHTAFVVADGKAQPRSVVLGEAVGDRFEVLSGLAPGDLAVVRGNERLRPGQAVRLPGPPGGQGPGATRKSAAGPAAGG